MPALKGRMGERRMKPIKHGVPVLGHPFMSTYLILFFWGEIEESEEKEKSEEGRAPRR